MSCSKKLELPSLPIGFITSQSAWQPGVYKLVNSTEPARLFRNGITSVCSQTKMCPGSFPSGPVAFSSFEFLNPTPRKSTCITVVFRSFDDGKAPVMSHAHADRYNPLDVCERYLGDAGTSGTIRTYQFILPKKTRKFAIVVENVNSNATFGTGNFTLSTATPPLVTAQTSLVEVQGPVDTPVKPLQT
jgi:hypothetical protein